MELKNKVAILFVCFLGLAFLLFVLFCMKNKNNEVYIMCGGLPSNKEICFIRTLMLDNVCAGA